LFYLLSKLQTSLGRNIFARDALVPIWFSETVKHIPQKNPIALDLARFLSFKAYPKHTLALNIVV
jgi:hypothetical protein